MMIVLTTSTGESIALEKELSRGEKEPFGRQIARGMWRKFITLLPLSELKS